MRINAHAHVFNLRAVFTRETLHILLNRLALDRAPKQLLDVLQDKLDAYLAKTIDAEAVFAKLDEKAGITEEFSGWVRKLGETGTSLDLEIGGVMARLSAEAADHLRARILELYDLDADGNIQQTWLDYLEFLRLALLPSMERVADAVLSQVHDDDILVALMMDITDGHDDGKLFRQQIRSTSDLVLAYPGRLLPFVKVNPLRPDHFELMRDALENQGFWGVKLYPSLGYPVVSDALFRVYAYCEERRIPVMSHCNARGFRKSADTGRLASPEPWRSVLTQFPKLKVCFGHFGGDENLIQDTIPADSWTRKILDLMVEFGAAGVYADLACHTDAMVGNAQLGIDAKTARRNYIRNVGGLLESHPARKRLLFGTDFWLVRQVTGDADYWKFFAKAFTPGQFQLLATANPVEYLGLPGAEAPSDWLRERHVGFFESKKMSAARPPARWLANAITATLGPAAKLVVLGPPSWSDTNVVHLILWEYLKNEQFRPTDVALKLPYADYGRFKLQNLIYWDQSAEPAAFATEVRGVASDINAVFMKRYGKATTFRDGITEVGARRRLCDALRNPDWYVYKLAELCESLYYVQTGLPEGGKA